MFHRRLLVDRLDHTDTWAQFAAKARRERRCDFGIYFRADQEELDAEIQWASSRRAVLKKEARAGERSDFDRSLTDVELRRKVRYGENCPEGGVCNLMQDPDDRPVCTKGKPILNTITKSADLLYSIERCRWLTISELGLVHNMPVASRDVHLCHFGAEPSYTKNPAECGLPPRRRAEVRSQLGNGMSVCCMSVGWTYIVLSLARMASRDAQREERKPTLLQELKRRRSE